jgi:hydroxypyruvate isomerase
LSDPALTVAFRDTVDCVGIAEKLGTRRFNALYGNRVDGLTPGAQDDTAAEDLSYASAAGAAIDATILLEPVSGAPHYPITTASDAVLIIDSVCDRTGATNIRLLADLYHLYVNWDDVLRAIEFYTSYIGHLQIADAPGRGEPGTGEVPLGDYLGRTLAAGDRGHGGLEYKASQTDPFGWLPWAEWVAMQRTRVRFGHT